MDAKMKEEYADGVETFDSVREALENVERRLAEDRQIPFRSIREELCAKALSGMLQEDELVREWHRRYAAYVDWVDDAQREKE